MTMPSDSANSPAPSMGWIDACAPRATRPWLHLARADKPIGFWLLMWPCWWSTALASDGWPDPVLLGLFLIGAIVMRTAGCVINDIMDRDFDAQVERTKTRPLASGAISLTGALIYLVLMLLAGLAVLVQLDRAAILIGAASLGLVGLYPYMKRITYWPQLFLGLTFNWGALVGWAAVRGDLSLTPLLLYAGCVCWTVGYDTIYAHQDKADDIRIGVKSTALALGDRTKPVVALFYGVFLTGLIAAGATVGLAWPFYAALVAASAHLVWQVTTAELNTPTSCMKRFVSNGQVGFLVFVAIVLGQIIAA